jgi:hypothetical protein
VGILRPAVRAPRDPGRSLLEAAAYAAVVAFALAIATRLGEHPVLPMLAITSGVLLVGWMAYSSRFELTLGILAAYLTLADGYLKLRFQGQLSLIGRDALLVAITFGAFARHMASRRPLAVPPLGGWVIGWTLIVLVELANPANGTLMHSVQALRPHIEFVPLFFLGYATMRSRASLKRLVWLLLVVTAINGAVGFVQTNLTPQQLATWGPGYAGKIYGTEQGVSGRGFVDDTGTLRTRPFALGSDQGFGGALAVISAPAALALIATTRRRQLLALAVPLAGGVALAAITSQARVAILGSLAGIAIYVLLGTAAKRRLATLMTIALGALATWLVVSAIASGAYSGVFDRYESIAPDKVVSTVIDYRRATVATIPQYVAQFPLGAGLGTVGPGGSTGGGNGRVLNGESEFTYLLIETGVAGFLVMLAFNFNLFSVVLRRVRSVADPDTRLLLAALAAPLFAMFLTWFGGAATAGTPNSPYLWFVGGVLSWWLLGAGRGDPAVEAAGG